MPTEPSGSVPFTSPECERATPSARAFEIALAQDIHSDQRIEFERVRQLDADHFLEDEWEARRPGLIRKQRNAKSIAFDLPFALGRFEGALTKAGQAQRLRQGK